jgi:uncharacterized protein (DUF2236 family)
MSRDFGGNADVGLFGPDSVTWRVHGDPIMVVAGLRALLLQALHPVALAGVTQHSSFRQDPWGRLTRTAEFVGVTTFGTMAEARRMGARVRGVHRRYAGHDPVTGRDYRVDDHDLLLWVHAGLVDSFLSTGRRAGLRLSPAEADRYVAEQVRVAELVGLLAEEVPASVGELADYMCRVRPELVASPQAHSVLRFVLAPPMATTVVIATPARPAWASLAALAVATLPRWARRLYRLPGLPTTDLAASAGLWALRTATLTLPAVAREGPHLKAARARLAITA